MIRIGKYGMKSDDHCWQIGVVGTRKTKDGDEVEILKRPIYPTTVQGAAKRLYEMSVRDADPQTLEELRAAMAEARAHADAILAVEAVSGVVGA